MKIWFNLLFFCALSAGAMAQASEVRKVGGFTGVKASEAIDVYLKKGDAESVKVEAEAKTLPRVLTEIKDNTLKVHMKSGTSNNSSVKIYVTYTKLDHISSSSAANVFSDGPIKAGTMDISASSAASVEITLDAEAVNVDVSSAGNIVLEGKSKSLEIEASSAGDINAYNLECESVKARANSAGSAKINVTKALEAHANSGGSIRYRGNPMKTNTQSNSGGSVKKSN
jgi:Putative auto-transporter adhesin, head GIN domain